MLFLFRHAVKGGNQGGTNNGCSGLEVHETCIRHIRKTSRHHDLDRHGLLHNRRDDIWTLTCPAFGQRKRTIVCGRWSLRVPPRPEPGQLWGEGLHRSAIVPGNWVALLPYLEDREKPNARTSDRPKAKPHSCTMTRPLRRDVPWTAEDDEFLREHARAGESVSEIAEQLNRVPSSVRNRALRLNIKLARSLRLKIDVDKDGWGH